MGRGRKSHRLFAAVRGLALPILGLLLILGVAGGAGAAAEHPTLVDPEKAVCQTCHDELLEVEVPHPPAVDDCLSCHTFDGTDDGMTVEVMAGGVALCLICHDTLEKAAAGELAAPHAPVIDDCSTCHDPHGTDFEAMLVEAGDQICLQCHDAGDTDAAHPIPVSRADCRTCHDAHGSEGAHMLRGATRHVPFEEGSCDACHRKPRGTKVRLLKPGGELCEACHGDMAEAEDPSMVHTAVRQGRCVACHDPHLADRARLIKADGGELCFTCHGEIAEAATGPGAHAALEDGCDSCHDAHHSGRPSLLLDDAEALCRACHDPEDPELPKKHFGADMATVRCGSCHDPHGSPIRPMIANGSLHAPFRDGCSNCHEGTANALAVDGNALCEMCHDDVVETISTAAVPHPAMEMMDCIDCHSPHASRQPSLLRSSGGELCLTCHDGQGGAKGDTVHGAIGWIGCQSCHLPHGGSEAKLLRAKGNDLCNGCHLQTRVDVDGTGDVRLAGGFVLRGERAQGLGLIDLDSAEQKNHPIPGHPVSGVIEKSGRSDVAESLVGREMTCRLCHEPHSAPGPKLYTWQAKTRSELCIACHQK